MGYHSGVTKPEPIRDVIDRVLLRLALGLPMPERRVIWTSRPREGSPVEAKRGPGGEA